MNTGWFFVEICENEKIVIKKIISYLAANGSGNGNAFFISMWEK